MKKKMKYQLKPSKTKTKSRIDVIEEESDQIQLKKRFYLTDNMIR